MLYTFTFKVKWQKKEKTLKFYSKDEVISIIKQLNKWITSLNWDLIKWVISLAYLKIIEHNYDEIDDKWMYLEYKQVKDSLSWEIFEVPEFCRLKNEDFYPIEKDITNNLLYECNVLTWNDWKVNYIHWDLIIYWEIFQLKKNTNYHDYFDLIFSTYERIWNNNFLYNELFETFNNKEYKMIIEKDINYNSIRDNLKDKLSKIKEEFNFDLMILWKYKITINI